MLERTGATVTRLEGCCGLAGNFGVEKGHYDVSVAIAEHQLLPAVRDAGPDAVVLATASPAAPSSTTSPTSRPCISPSSSLVGPGPLVLYLTCGHSVVLSAVPGVFQADGRAL